MVCHLGSVVTYKMVSILIRHRQAKLFAHLLLSSRKILAMNAIREVKEKCALCVVREVEARPTAGSGVQCG